MTVNYYYKSRYRILLRGSQNSCMKQGQSAILLRTNWPKWLEQANRQSLVSRMLITTDIQYVHWQGSHAL